MSAALCGDVGMDGRILVVMKCQRGASDDVIGDSRNSAVMPMKFQREMNLADSSLAQKVPRLMSNRLATQNPVQWISRIGS